MASGDAHLPKKLDIPDHGAQEQLPRLELGRGDLVRWNEIVAEVIDIAHLGPGHDQVVLQRLDRRALLISLPVSDLIGAEVWQFAGHLV